MASVLSSLYPPLVDTFMPAFPVKENAVINFSISPYNSRTSITKLHVSVVDQRTNLSVLKPSGSLENGSIFVNNIWIMNADNSNLNNLHINSDNTCQLTIPKEALKDEEFITSNYYKVQLRFSNDVEELSTSLSNSYLTTKRPYFSEWSSVCLIKAIPEISLQIVGYESINNFKKLEENSFNDPKNFPAGIIPIAGTLLFKYSIDLKEDNTNLINDYYYQISTKDQETLRSYKIIVQNENEEIVDESEIIYTYKDEHPNDIYWLADLTNETVNKKYKITINCTTKNQYNFSFSYYIALSNVFDSSFDDETVTWILGNKIYNKEIEVCKYPDLQEDGQLKINITIDNSVKLGPGYLYVKRATSLDNFKHWEIIKCSKFSANENISEEIIDTTIGSLIRYKYSCQYRQSKGGNWTKTVFSPEIIYPDFSDILLSRGNRQLAIRYNGQISGITPIVNRVKIDTLGGKYPKFAENAKMNYKQFQLSGMIIAESDYNRKFLNDLDYKEDIDFYDQEMNGQYLLRNDTLPDIWPNTQYGIYHNDIAIAKDPQGNPTKIQEHKRDTSEFKYIPPETQTVSINESNPNNPTIVTTPIYPENIVAHDIYPTNNWWWERLFREEAIKWLNDGEPKLFRSMAEGNMVVMLTDISLTPNPQVGRRTYNFSATAYEIADGYSLDVLSDLKIWNLQNDFETNPITEADSISHEETIGQFLSVNNTILNQTSLVNNIEEYYRLYYAGTNIGDNERPSFLLSQNSVILKNIKIQFESKPRWYKIYKNNTISYVEVKNPLESTDDRNNYALGYHLQLKVQGVQGNIDIFVNEKGYYQVPSNINVLDIILEPYDTATINYILNYALEVDDSNVAETTTIIDSIIGQLNGLWYPDTYLQPIISTKYKYIENDETNKIIADQNFENWQGISFDVSPYTLVGIKFNKEDDFSDFLIGRTGVYDLMKNVEIKDVIIKGRRMFKVYDTGSEENTSKKYNLDEWEFVKETESYNSIESIIQPKYNHVYLINNIYKIYYIDDQWYDFNFDYNDDDIGLAKVPINGIINYKGEIIKRTY